MFKCGPGIRRVITNRLSKQKRLPSWQLCWRLNGIYFSSQKTVSVIESPSSNDQSCSHRVCLLAFVILLDWAVIHLCDPLLPLRVCTGLTRTEARMRADGWPSMQMMWKLDRSWPWWLMMKDPTTWRILLKRLSSSWGAVISIALVSGNITYPQELKKPSHQSTGFSHFALCNTASPRSEQDVWFAKISEKYFHLGNVTFNVMARTDS